MGARIVLRGCGAELYYRGRGRPPRRCHDCKLLNKAEIAAKKRAREHRLCSECGETLRQAVETGLCGFCEAERQEAA